MKALALFPGKPDSAELIDVPEPPEEDGAILAETVAVGVDGTDYEILAGQYGSAPPGEERLIMCHESLGRILDAPAGTGFQPGDPVVGIVRRPDPVPCPNCAVGEWDMCRNGQYTERGIKDRNGYCSERFRIEPEFAIKPDRALGRLAVLTEPTSIVAKAWEHVDRIGSRARWDPRRALVTGAGPVGLLAAMMGRQRGLEVHVLDRVTEGLKPILVEELGATYHAGSIDEAGEGFDVIIEATGFGPLVLHAVEHVAADGVMCLVGIASSDQQVSVDAFGLNKDMVLRNVAVFGSVNAGRRHYEQASRALSAADAGWLDRMVTRWVPLAEWPEALARRPDDVKTVIEVAAA